MGRRSEEGLIEHTQHSPRCRRNRDVISQPSHGPVAWAQGRKPSIVAVSCSAAAASAVRRSALSSTQPGCFQVLLYRFPWPRGRLFAMLPDRPYWCHSDADH